MNTVLAREIHPSEEKCKGRAGEKNPVIHANFFKRKIVSGKVVDDGDPLLIDITLIVLTRPVNILHKVRDSHASSDALVPYALHWHDGIYRVEVENSICKHFGVEKLSDITQSMVRDSREAMHLGKYRSRVNDFNDRFPVSSKLLLCKSLSVTP